MLAKESFQISHLRLFYFLCCKSSQLIAIDSFLVYSLLYSTSQCIMSNLFKLLHFSLFLYTYFYSLKGSNILRIKNDKCFNVQSSKCKGKVDFLTHHILITVKGKIYFLCFYSIKIKNYIYILLKREKEKKKTSLIYVVFFYESYIYIYLRKKSHMIWLTIHIMTIHEYICEKTNLFFLFQSYLLDIYIYTWLF